MIPIALIAIAIIMLLTMISFGGLFDYSDDDVVNTTTTNQSNYNVNEKTSIAVGGSSVNASSDTDAGQSTEVKQEGTIMDKIKSNWVWVLVIGGILVVIGVFVAWKKGMFKKLKRR